MQTREHKTAFRARKFTGTFEKRAPGSCGRRLKGNGRDCYAVYLALGGGGGGRGLKDGQRISGNYVTTAKGAEKSNVLPLLGPWCLKQEIDYYLLSERIYHSQFHRISPFVTFQRFFSLYICFRLKEMITMRGRFWTLPQMLLNVSFAYCCNP